MAIKVSKIYGMDIYTDGGKFLDLDIQPTLGAQAPFIVGMPTIRLQSGDVTELVGTPIEITVYKLGDTYYGARSNEFGFANYEIIPAVAEVSPLR